jgi:hypothetical protein
MRKGVKTGLFGNAVSTSDSILLSVKVVSGWLIEKDVEENGRSIFQDSI